MPHLKLTKPATKSLRFPMGIRVRVPKQHQRATAAGGPTPEVPSKPDFGPSYKIEDVIALPVPQLSAKERRLAAKGYLGYRVAFTLRRPSTVCVGSRVLARDVSDVIRVLRCRFKTRLWQVTEVRKLEHSDFHSFGFISS